ncbi:MAG: ABC transporter ATP-binding protein [Deltaproteobacteria bacterium]|nr:ABC transporter ATP-binding protein [Nannocystaceae bacterium]
MSQLDDIDDEIRNARPLDWALWRRLLIHVRPYRGKVAALVASGLVLAGIDIALPLVTGELVDRATLGGRGGDLDALWWAYGGLLVLFAALIWVLIVLAGRIASGVGHDLRQAGFVRLQQLSFAYFDRRPVGWLVSRLIADCDKISGLLPWFSLDLTWGPALATGVAVAMWVVEPTLALWVLAIVPPLALISVFFRRRLLGNARLLRRTNARITAAFDEAVMGVRTTKTLVREVDALREFSEMAGDARGYAIREALLGAVYLPVVISLGAVGVGFALWQGGVRVGDGMSLGTLVAFMQFAALFHVPIEDIARRLADLQAAQAAAERVQTLLDTEPDIRDTPEVEAAIARALAGPRAPGTAIDGMPARIREIEMRGVSFGYDPDRPVLHDVDLHVREGQSIALVGETGGGKSTLVNLLARFYELQHGSILLDGIDHRRRSLQWLQSSLGVVLQSPQLFAGTITDNIRYGKLAASDAEVVAAARLAHADRFIAELPEGYQTPVGEGGTRLSTGQRQLVALARAILADPQILVLDEATSSVDTETEALIQAGIDEVLRGRISFVIAHRLSTIRNADLICVIEDGRIVERGDHASLMALVGRYHALVHRSSAEAIGRRGA